MTLLAGIDDLSLDNRTFEPSRDDIEKICRFFSIGKLENYKKEKDVTVSHSNFFVFVATTRGQYALKFYPANTARMIAIEYAVNRLLIARDFPTPVMHTGLRQQPSVASHGRLAACYSFIDGVPVWKKIQQRGIIQQVNASMLLLKNILSANGKNIPYQKQVSLVKTISTMTQRSRLMAPYEQKKLIDASLREGYRRYQHHQPLFTRQWLHNNTGLTNFLIHQKTVYTLDLSHIKEDYILADLASLVISCFFFNVPQASIKAITRDHFTMHQIKPECLIVLNTLVKVGLVKEYLKNIEREKAVKMGPYPPKIARTYLSHLSKRKRSITTLLNKMADLGA